MRVVREISHPYCKITVFSWNNRYIIKLEADRLEQTFKVDAFDFINDDELIKLLDATFLEEAVSRFKSMADSLLMARNRLDE